MKYLIMKRIMRIEEFEEIQARLNNIEFKVDTLLKDLKDKTFYPKLKENEKSRIKEKQ